MQTSGIRLWLILWKAYDTLRTHAERDIAARGMGLSDFGVLEILLHKGPLAVNTIGPMLRLTSGAISVAIDRLEKKGLVERRADAGDRRARIVHLTPEGRTTGECMFADHTLAMEHAAKGLSDAERTQAVALLKKLGLAAQAQLTDDKRRLT